jgi:CP family cyanate transporter-like MFS transporter
LRLALLWLIGCNLRVSVLALPPVLPLIHRDLQLSESGVAAIAGVPLLLFGLGALPGGLLIARVGAQRAILVGLPLVGVCAALRGVGPSVTVLFAATAGLGTAIAITQPAIPTLAQHWFPQRVPRATSTWANGLLMGTVLSASLSLPLILPLVGQSWQWTLVIWAIPAPLAALLLGLEVRNSHGSVQSRRASRWLPDWRDHRLWQVGLLQAAGTLCYFGASTFIPDYLQATGRSGLTAVALAGLSLGQIPGSLLVGVARWSRIDRTSTALGLGAAVFLALCGLLIAPTFVFVAAATLLGAACGATLVIALALPPLLAKPSDVPRMASGALCIGYSLVWLTLLAAGTAWDFLHAPAVAFLPAAIGSALILAVGPRLLGDAQTRPRTHSPKTDSALAHYRHQASIESAHRGRGARGASL